MLKRTILVAVALVSAADLSFAAGRLQKALQKLEPTTRMIEVCDLAVSSRISKETSYSRVDRVVADAVSETVTGANSVTAGGAAFRDHGKWYGLRYSCTVTTDHMAMKSLRYDVGHEIPESDWEQYGLWH